MYPSSTQPFPLRASLVPVILLLFVVLLTGGTACVRDPVTGKSRFSVVSWTPQEELELGREQAPNVESSFDAAYADRTVNNILGNLVAEMVNHSVRKQDFDFRFKVLNSSIPNAFALPGGFVYITRGLLQTLESEAQFISVMGHELGHVEHQHSMYNQSRGTLAGVLTAPLRGAAALARGLPGGRVVNLAAGVAAAPLGLWGLRFSRDQELEADERGVFFSAEMGYDPREGVKTFRMFERLEREAGGSFLTTEMSLFRTHPLNRDRVAHIEKTAAEKYPELVKKPASEFRRDTPEFRAILERFKNEAPAYALYDEAVALMGKDDTTPAAQTVADEKLGEAVSKRPNEPLFRIAQGEASMAKGNRAVAREHFSAALDLYARHMPSDSHWKAHLYLGILELDANQASKAVAQLEKAAGLFPMHPGVHLLLGEAYERAGKTQEAKVAYRRVLALTSPDSELHAEARARLRRLG